MKLLNARISNYRSIKDEQSIVFDISTTLIGPNNSGKTNALRAIALLFGGYENKFLYDREKDLPVDRPTKQTSVIGTFEIQSEEKWFWDKFDRLHELQGTTRDGNNVTLYLYFTATNTPVYSFFANIKRPNDKKADYSRVLRSLVSDLVEKYNVIYIPSEKSIVDLYSQLLAPRVSKKASSILSAALPQLKAELEMIGKSISTTLQNSGISESTVQMEVPDDDLMSIVGEFSLSVTDTVKTNYTQKGRGLQAAIFYASLHWVDERIREDGKIPFWLIEEPESYMHPELAKNCRLMLAMIARNSMTVISTHSMQFLPREPAGIHSFTLKEAATNISRFIKYDEACNALKKSLGLRFSDYYSLGDCNVLLEGKWDAYVIRETLSHISKISETQFPKLTSAVLIEKDGVSALVGFLRAVYDHVRKEVAAVTVFDGDDAGVRARKELQGFFSHRGEFQSNIDFVSVRSGYPMEGIFPDDWIKQCNAEHSGWFKTWSVDASGNVEPFEIEDDKKEGYAKYMCTKVLAESDASRLTMLKNLFVAIDTALAEQHKKLAQVDNAQIKTLPQEAKSTPPMQSSNAVVEDQSN